MSGPVDREEFGRMARELERMRSEGAQEATIPLPGGAFMKVQRVPGTVAGARIDADGMSARTYDPSETRPEDYPADMPFVPGVAVVVQQVPDEVRVLLFFKAPDPEALCSAIVQQLGEEGWTQTERVDVPMIAGSVTSFQRDARVRELVAAAPMVTLLEKS